MAVAAFCVEGLLVNEHFYENGRGPLLYFWIIYA